MSSAPATTVAASNTTAAPTTTVAPTGNAAPTTTTTTGAASAGVPDQYPQFEYHQAAPRHHHYSYAWRYLPHLLASFVLEGYVLESVLDDEILPPPPPPPLASSSSPVAASPTGSNINTKATTSPSVVTKINVAEDSSSSGWGSESDKNNAGDGDDTLLLTSDVEGVADENWGSSCSSLHYEVPGGSSQAQLDPDQEAKRRRRRLRRKHDRRAHRKEKAIRVAREQTASFALDNHTTGGGTSGAAGGSVMSAAAAVVHLNEEVNDYWSSSDASNDRHTTKFNKNLEKRYKRQIEHSEKLRVRSQAIIETMLTPPQQKRLVQAQELQAELSDGDTTPLLGTNVTPSAVTTPVHRHGDGGPPSHPHVVASKAPTTTSTNSKKNNKSSSKSSAPSFRTAADENDPSVIPHVAELTLKTILFPLDKECLTNVMSQYRHKLRLFGYRYSRREARELYLQDLDRGRATIKGAVANALSELSRAQDPAAKEHYQATIVEKEKSLKDIERTLVDITMFEVSRIEYLHARQTYHKALAQLPRSIRESITKNRRLDSKKKKASQQEEGGVSANGGSDVNNHTLIPANFPEYPMPPVDPVSASTIDSYRSKGFHLEVAEIRQRIDSSRLPLFVVNPPSISLADYYCRLMSTMKCSPECYLWSLCLIQKIAKLKRVLVTSRSIHRLVLASVVVSAKMRDDRYYANPHYAAGGTVSREDMRAMERTFCSALGFDCNVSPLEYLEMVLSLRQHCSGLYHYKSIGWASEAWKEILAWLPLPDTPRLRGQFVGHIAYHGNPAADRAKECASIFKETTTTSNSSTSKPIVDEKSCIEKAAVSEGDSSNQQENGITTSTTSTSQNKQQNEASTAEEQQRRSQQQHQQRVPAASVVPPLPQTTSSVEGGTTTKSVASASKGGGGGSHSYSSSRSTRSEDIIQLPTEQELAQENKHLEERKRLGNYHSHNIVIAPMSSSSANHNASATSGGGGGAQPGMLSNLPRRSSDLSGSGSARPHQHHGDQQNHSTTTTVAGSNNKAGGGGGGGSVDDSNDSALGLTTFQVLKGGADGGGVTSPAHARGGGGKNNNNVDSVTSIGYGMQGVATTTTTNNNTFNTVNNNNNGLGGSYLSSEAQSARFQSMGAVQHPTAGMPGQYQLVSGVAGASTYAASTASSFGPLSYTSNSNSMSPIHPPHHHVIARSANTTTTTTVTTAGPARSVLPQVQPLWAAVASDSSSASVNTPSGGSRVNSPPPPHAAGGGFVYAAHHQQGHRNSTTSSVVSPPASSRSNGGGATTATYSVPSGANPIRTVVAAPTCTNHMGGGGGGLAGGGGMRPGVAVVHHHHQNSTTDSSPPHGTNSRSHFPQPPHHAPSQAVGSPNGSSLRRNQLEHHEQHDDGGRIIHSSNQQNSNSNINLVRRSAPAGVLPTTSSSGGGGLTAFPQQTSEDHQQQQHQHFSPPQSLDASQQQALRVFTSEEVLQTRNHHNNQQ